MAEPDMTRQIRQPGDGGEGRYFDGVLLLGVVANVSKTKRRAIDSLSGSVLNWRKTGIFEEIYVM
jgi:hypothetical protein